MNKKILVVLDPGHYPNYNKGAVAGYFEGDRMYDLSKYEKAELETYGIDVLLTRERSHDKGLYDRGQVAVKNAKGYDEVVFISNHTNAGNGKASGVEVYRSNYLPGSERLAEKLIDAIVKVMEKTGVTKSRGVKTRTGGNGDYYGVIRGSVSGACNEVQAVKGPVGYSYIVEHGFHDNVKECKFLNDNNNLKMIARAKAEVIAEYFGLTRKKAVKEEPSKSFKVRVKVKELNYRAGAGTKYEVKGSLKKGETYTIVATSGSWGKLKSGAGWINVSNKYVTRL